MEMDTSVSGAATAMMKSATARITIEIVMTAGDETVTTAEVTTGTMMAIGGEDENRVIR